MSLSHPEPAIVPPPWTLTGRAYVMIYKWTGRYIAERVTLPPALGGRFRPSLGAMMLVDYDSSPVGPYREVLFIPGQFRINQKKHWSVTQILVDSAASRESGRANWAIPKEDGAFAWSPLSDGDDGDAIQVSYGGQAFLDVRFKVGRFRFPVNNWWYPVSIAQPADDSFYITSIHASGTASLAEISHIESHAAAGFPDVTRANPFGVVHLSRFTVTLPAPKAVSAG
ncbi:MAG: hypothetical protein SF029_15195 [bacterium]|nr:hypothetical protein [bacterium]